MRIYHTSDLHDHRAIAQPLRALRAQQPGLLFDCGDSLRGSQTVYHRSEPIVAAIDEAGYDAQAMGNREFHYLFGCVRARIAAMHHPVVCSNLVDLKNRPLPFARRHIIRHEDQGRLIPVHVFGLLVRQYPIGSLWERIFGWRFLDPIAVLEQAVNDLAPDEPLVVLSHLGLPYDRIVARAIPRIDLILGGHSHDTLEQPEFVAGVPIVHAGPYGKFVSRTNLESRAARWRVRDFSLLPLIA